MILDFLFQNNGGSRAITSEELVRILSRGWSSSSGVDVTPSTAMQLAAVFSCVRVLAESVGQLPFPLYRQQGKSKERATDHPLYTLLQDAPNDEMTAQEFWEFVVACLALRGNAYAQIIRLRGRVLSLEPLLPSSVRPRRDAKTEEVVYDITLADSSIETLPAAEVLHIKLFPLDATMGASPISHARESIGLAIAQERHGAGLFKNGANPGGVLSFPKSLNEASQKLLRESWEARHAGADNAHKVAVLEEGGKFEHIGLSSVDAQWLEGRKYQRSEIAGIYRVPPHFIGDLERATFGNIEHQSLDFVVHSVVPYLRRIEQRVKLQLLTREERREFYAKFTVAGLLRGDMAARSAYYTAQLQNGAMSPNEIRELEDMNPREGGDVYLVPMNLTSDPEAAAQKKAPPPPEK